MARTNVGAAAKDALSAAIRTTEKTLKALESQEAGLNYTQISKKFRVPPACTACRYVLSELEKPRRQNAGEEAVHVRDLELQRLDDLYLIAYRAIIDGYDLAGIDRCLRIMERRIKSSSGIDAAEKVEHSGDPRDQPVLRSVRHGESRMSDEVPFTAINFPVPLRSSRRESGRPGTRLLRRVGVEQVDQRRTDFPLLKQFTRHEDSPRSACSSPGNGCPR